MATPHLFSPSTWRVLGLSVAASYTSLGFTGIFAPKVAANLLGVWPTNSSTSEADNLISASLVLLGVRDLSIGIALFAFDYRREPKSMGVLILSALVLCFVDSLWVARAKSKALGVSFAAGASIWAWIGLNLLEI